MAYILNGIGKKVPYAIHVSDETRVLQEGTDC